MIIDFHTHILPSSFRGRRQAIAKADPTFDALFSQRGAKMATARELISAMDEDGVDMSVVLGYGWCDPDVAHEANDYLLDAAERYPKRIIPFCSVHPGWGEAALKEIEHCFKSGAKGIGELHPTSQRIDLGKDRHLPAIMRFAKAHDMPVVVHGSEPVGHQYAGKGTTHPDSLMAMIERFPDAKIVGAHWGGGLPFYALMPEVKKSLANSYFDTAASPFLYEPAIYPAVAKAIGAGQVLFGSDFPLLRARRVAEEAVGSLPAKSVNAVMGDNAAKLLGLTP